MYYLFYICVIYTTLSTDPFIDIYLKNAYLKFYISIFSYYIHYYIF